MSGINASRVVMRTVETQTILGPPNGNGYRTPIAERERRDKGDWGRWRTKPESVLLDADDMERVAQLMRKADT